MESHTIMGYNISFSQSNKLTKYNSWRNWGSYYPKIAQNTRDAWTPRGQVTHICVRNLNVIGSDNFQIILSMRFPENVQELSIWPISLSQNYVKICETNGLPPISNRFWRRLGYINIPYFIPFLPCVFYKMCWNLSRSTLSPTVGGDI